MLLFYVAIDAYNSIKIIRFNIFEVFLEEAVFQKSEKENFENY